MPKPPSKPQPMSSAQRVARHRANGLTVVVTLQDAAAIKTLRALRKDTGSYRRALEAALLFWDDESST